MCWLKIDPTGSKQRLGLVSGAAPGREGGKETDRETDRKKPGRAREQGGMLGYIRSLLLGKEEL